jgi:hypothetical protein
LYGRLLDERLRLAVQVSHLGRRRCGLRLEQRRSCDQHLAYARWHVWVVDVEVGVDALAGLFAQLTHTFAVRGGFPSDGGVQ